MPHINIKCYPKHLNEVEFTNFIDELNAVIQKHLKATDEVISIQYTEIDSENWGEVYHNEIEPNLAILAKKPGYKL